MRRGWLVLAIAAWPLAAQADTFHRLVGYACDRRAGELVFTYRGAWNEAGEALLATKARTEWNPLDLAHLVDDDHYGKSAVIEARCQLGHRGYRIRLGANPQGGSMDRRCGMEIGGWIEVRREDAPAFRHDFARDCELRERVVTRLVFRPDAAEPAETSVDSGEFFK
jgi:hypothetical protein